MNTDRPISALSHTVETADMSLYDLTSAITPAQSGYTLMLAKISVLVSLDHKIKIPIYLTDANIAAFVSQLGIDFNYSYAQLKKAMAAINYVNDRTGFANTLDKRLYPQLQLVKYVGKFYCLLLYFFLFSLPFYCKYLRNLSPSVKRILRTQIRHHFLVLNNFDQFMNWRVRMNT